MDGLSSTMRMDKDALIVYLNQPEPVVVPVLERDEVFA
jgi:hypothetical protein